MPCTAKSDINVNIVFTVIQSSTRMFVSLRKPSYLEGGDFNLIITIGQQFKL